MLINEIFTPNTIAVGFLTTYVLMTSFTSHLWRTFTTLMNGHGRMVVHAGISWPSSYDKGFPFDPRNKMASRRRGGPTNRLELCQKKCEQPHALTCARCPQWCRGNYTNCKTNQTKTTKAVRSFIAASWIKISCEGCESWDPKPFYSSGQA